MMSWPAWTEIAGLLLVCLALVAVMRRHRSGTTALFVTVGPRSILEEKVPTLAHFLKAALLPRGFFALNPLCCALATGVERSGFDSEVLRRSRGLGADYALVVGLHDLNCEVDESRTRDLSALRVNTVLCVDYRMIDVGSGRVLEEQTLALCRTTAPVVRGTSVGSDVIDRLMGEVAARIVEKVGALRLAA